jgi:hypothetical protein
MEKGLPAVVVLAALVAVLAGCGTTPQPTPPPPTQTPWIIVVTATPGGDGTGSGAPTQTPWIVVATPTRQGTRAPGSTRAPAATPTLVPPPPLKYPAPVPIEPPDRQPISWQSIVLLKWTEVGDLAPDEYYKLHLERRGQAPGEVWYGDYIYTKEPEYRAQGPFLAPFHPPAADGKAEVHWWVSVVQKTGEDEHGKPVGVDLSPKSEERTLLLDPKPEDS